MTIPIDEDHSGMVKFARGNGMIPILAAKLLEICHISGAESDLALAEAQISDTAAGPLISAIPVGLSADVQDTKHLRPEWDFNGMGYFIPLELPS